MTDRFTAAQSDVTKVFDAPEDIVCACDLSKSRKVALLRQWEIDLRQLMVASDENMPEMPGRSSAGERLQRVHAALARLGAESDPDKGAPTIAG